MLVLCSRRRIIACHKPNAVWAFGRLRFGFKRPSGVGFMLTCNALKANGGILYKLCIIHPLLSGSLTMGQFTCLYEYN